MTKGFSGREPDSLSVFIFLIFSVDRRKDGWYIYYDRHSTTGKATIGVVPTGGATIDKVQNACVIKSQNRRKGDEQMEQGMAGISSDVIRGYNDTMILFILSREPSYGYEISKQIRTLTEEKYIIKETTLYSAFTRMEKNGYIESFVAEPDATGSGKKRTYYRITEQGREYYRQKCEEWTLTKEVVEHFIANETVTDRDVILLGMNQG